MTLLYIAIVETILLVSGVAVYEYIFYSRSLAFDREIDSVLTSLHDSFEVILQKPSTLEPEMAALVPNLCSIEQSCYLKIDRPEFHAVGPVWRENYSIFLLDLSGKPIATAGSISSSDLETRISNIENLENAHKILSDEAGTRYEYHSILLHTRTGENWGYLIVGKSWRETDLELRTIRWSLIGFFVTASVALGAASWWLASFALQPVYRSYQKMQQFTEDAAHELRTPLAVVHTQVETLLRQQNTEKSEFKTSLRTILRQNDRLAKLVTDLLYLARLDRKQDTTKLQRFYLNDILEDLAQELVTLASKANVNLEIKSTAVPKLEVAGREAQLYRAIYNIASNAVRYTPSGGCVIVDLDSTSSEAIVQIRDTGIGISAEDQQHIFDRFYRVDRHQSRKTSGSGLGLSIARAIVETHGGKIDLHSQRDRGSTFTVRLPKNRDRRTSLLG
ncbi:ATP-binding protein [Geitlerinema sp. CS-897]|nr:ATP-binding protein [Geitlerinema sp. CS-897]